MGIILATAANHDGRNVVQTESYGPEARGGYSRSDVIIANDPIDYPKLVQADLLVALSQEAANAYVEGLAKDGVFIYDSDNVTTPPHFTGTSIGIPFTRLAKEETGRVQTTNVLALGAVVGITGIVSVAVDPPSRVRRGAGRYPGAERSGAGSRVGRGPIGVGVVAEVVWGRAPSGQGRGTGQTRGGEMGGTKSGFSQPAIGDGPAPKRAGLLAARGLLEIRFGGTAEQGVVLMGLVLATAATLDHRYVAQTQTHGLEESESDVLGHCDVIISDDPVDYPELLGIDLLVALGQGAADANMPLLRADGVFVYDSECVKSARL